MGIGFRHARGFGGMGRMWDRQVRCGWVRGVRRLAWHGAATGFFERADRARRHTSPAVTGWWSAWAKNVERDDHRRLRRVQPRCLVQCCAGE
jgi:hypothetical protein